MYKSYETPMKDQQKSATFFSKHLNIINLVIAITGLYLYPCIAHCTSFESEKTVTSIRVSIKLHKDMHEAIYVVENVGTALQVIYMS